MKYLYEIETPEGITRKWFPNELMEGGKYAAYTGGEHIIFRALQHINTIG